MPHRLTTSISRRSSRLTLALVTAGLLAPAAAPWAQAQPLPAVTTNANSLPSLGDSASDDVSVGLERRVGDRIMRDIKRDPDYIDDPVLLEYLQQIWTKLLSSTRARGNIPDELNERFAWQVFLVRDRTINAFALPGGFVGVHLGLIAMTTSPDELASVMAHEMSHVTQRHIARSVGAGRTTSLVSIAGLILGILAASRSPDAASALITGGQAVSAQGQLNYSRDAEREADRVGFQVMTGAGYAPAGMADMFQKLALASRLNDSQNFPYLRSHPLTTERIGEARLRIGVGAAGMVSHPMLHALMQARARVLMDTRDGALQRMQDFDSARAAAGNDPTNDKLQGLYASALASVLRRDYARADASIAAARPIVAAEPAAEHVLDMLTVQSLLARGDGRRAGVLIDRMLAEPGGQDSRALLLAQAERALVPDASMDTPERQRQVADRLQTWVSLHGDDAQAWSDLSQLWGRLGQQLRSVRAEAESRAASGDVQGAVDRLRAGQKLARSPASSSDFIEASVIEARLREMEKLRKQLVAEERGDS